MTLHLRILTPTDGSAFFQGLKEFEGDDLAWYTFIWKPGMLYSDMLDRLRKDSAGEDLAPGRVAHTMLYAFVDDCIVGRLSVRHELNERLRHRGGHIGYAVAKRFRRKGYATEIVRQGLIFCAKLGIHPIMVTCGDTNTPSWKIIERFGGKLQDTIWDEEDKEMTRRYWINREVRCGA